MYIIYSKPNSPVRVTVVGTYENGTLTCAVARCSKVDNFSKKKGREIATSRLNDGNHYQKVQLDSCDAKQFVTIANGIIKEVEEKPLVYNSEIAKKVRDNFVRRKKQQLYSKLSRIRKQLISLDLNVKKYEDSKIIDIFNSPIKEPEEVMHAKFADPEE